jgi:GntR family transcriptional regulator
METSLLDRRVLLHEQVRDWLVAEIAAGRLKPGDQVPTEVELTLKFGVSRTTVRQALQDLVTAGLINRQPGRGSYVSHPRIEQELVRLTGFVEDMQSLGLKATARPVLIETIPADDIVAKRLGLRTGDVVTHIQRVRLANDEPISFDDTFLPGPIGEEIAREDLTADPIFWLLEEKYGVRLGEADYAIEATTAPPLVARNLGIGVDAPILLIERTTYASDGRPIDFERLHYIGERMRYRVRLRR